MTTDNTSAKRRGQYIAYTVTRAADGPDGMEARGRPFSVGGKGFHVVVLREVYGQTVNR